LAVVLLAPPPAFAEWQIKPFLGLTFADNTTLLLTPPSSHVNHVIGSSGMLLGEVIGVEADVAHVPGFFQPNPFNVVVASGVTTYTGNVVVAVPRRMARYTLRPYAVAGGGLMRAHIDGVANALLVQSNLAVIDVGAGVTGFLTNHVGVCWDVRHFGSVGGKDRMQALSIGAEQLSFWRVTMAIAIRFQ